MTAWRARASSGDNTILSISLSGRKMYCSLILIMTGWPMIHHYHYCTFTSLTYIPSGETQWTTKLKHIACILILLLVTSAVKLKNPNSMCNWCRSVKLTPQVCIQATGASKSLAFCWHSWEWMRLRCWTWRVRSPVWENVGRANSETSVAFPLHRRLTAVRKEKITANDKI